MDEESPVLVIFVEDYDGRGKKNLIKKAKLYKCNYCPYKSHDQSRVQRHKKKPCQEKVLIKKSQISEARQQQRIHQLIEKSDKNIIGSSEAQIQQIKKTLSSMQKQMQQMKRYSGGDVQLGNRIKQQIPELAKRFSQEAFQSIGSIIVNNMRAKFSATVERALYTGINVHKIKNVIYSNILNRTSEVGFEDVLFDFSQKLKEAHQQIQKQAKQRSSNSQQVPRTIANNQRAFHFFSQFQEFNFVFQIEIINEMMKLGEWTRKDYRRYFMLLRQKSYYFKKFPPLPVFRCSKYKNIVPKINIDDVKQQICFLFNKGDRTLACDIFMILCMGLRKSQLMRIYFKAQNGEFCNSLTIKQSKNSNITKRYIPQSLVQLMQFSRTDYPIGMQRLFQARSHCINTFKSFYNLRHICITEIISSLMKSHEFANFHRSSSTTSKFYVNENDINFINAAFELKINKPSDFELQKKPRKVQLDFTYAPVRQKILEQKKMEITIQKMDDIVTSAEDDSILNKQVSAIDIINDKNIEDLEKSKLIAKIDTYEKFGIELQSQAKISFLQILQNFFSNQTFLRAVYLYLSTRGYMTSNLNMLKSINDLTEEKIIYMQYNSTCENASKSVTFEGKKMSENISDSTIIVSRCQTQYLSNVVEKIDLIQPKIPNELNFEQKGPQKKYFELTNENPRCTCKKGYLWASHNDEGDVILVCDYCKRQKKYPHLKNGQSKLTVYEPRQMKIKTLFKAEITDPHISLKKSSQRNNFRQTIQKIYGKECYSKQCYYAADVPKFLKTPYCKFSRQIQSQLIYNRANEEWLPLQIRESQIPNAGLGVYNLTQICENSIIMCYSGVISTIFSCEFNNDSLFAVGWCMTNPPKQLLIEPKLRLNAGRFLNSQTHQYPANCFVRIGIFANRQICVYIFTNRKIKAGAELVYSYGQNYQIKEKQSQKQIQLLKKSEIQDSKEKRKSKRSDSNFNFIQELLGEEHQISEENQKQNSRKEQISQRIMDLENDFNQLNQKQPIEINQQIEQTYDFLGLKIGRNYSVLERIGSGHFSTVWLSQYVKFQDSPAQLRQQIGKKQNEELKKSRFYAIKIMKNKQNYNRYLDEELQILKKIQIQKIDKRWLDYLNQFKKQNQKFITREFSVGLQYYEKIVEKTQYGQSSCLVLQLLGPNLYQIMQHYQKHSMFMPLNLIKKIVSDVLIQMVFLHEYCGIIHTDIKPENIALKKHLLENLVAESRSKINQTQRKSSRKKTKLKTNYANEEDSKRVRQSQSVKEKQKDRTIDIFIWKNVQIDLEENIQFKIIDFGNACNLESKKIQIQTKEYRSPEVIIGGDYSFNADVWSLACTVFQMMTHSFLFNPTSSSGCPKIQRLSKMVEILGPFSKQFALSGSLSDNFFKKDGTLIKGSLIKTVSISELLHKQYGYYKKQALQTEKFLLPMLKHQPSKRISAKDCLKSKWLIS